MAEFQCRTKTISGIRYRIRWYGPDGSLRASSSRETKEAADQELTKEAYKKAGYTLEIIPEHWTEEVCIECGR